jgi:hypothetical protein
MTELHATRTVEKSVHVGTVCDSCGKTWRKPPEPKNSPFLTAEERVEAERRRAEDPYWSWHNFDRHHSDWGNDSVESRESYDACSPECYLSLLAEAVAALDGYPTGEVDDMPVMFVSALLKHIAELKAGA